MKIISINIPPIDKAHDDLLRSRISESSRSRNVIRSINEQDPDVVFFIEQYGPVYKTVKEEIQEKYQFITPSGFEPSERAFAGVVAAVKKDITIDKIIDGKDLKIKKSAKVLGLNVSGEWLLSVHYPQPSDIGDFDLKIKKFVASNNVRILIGDFNPKCGTKQQIDGYKDVIDNNRMTTLYNNKLDFVFISKLNVTDENDIIFDSSVMDENSGNFFSDHVLTGVIIK